MKSVFLLSLLLLFAPSCGREEKSAPPAPHQTAGDRPDRPTGDPDLAELVEGNCGSCHLRPDPAELPRGIWDSVVFPRMGYFVGIYPADVSRASLLGDAPAERMRLETANVFPPTPKIDPADWQRIKDYYLSSAPLRLPPTAFKAEETASGFRVRYPAVFLSPPSTSWVRILPEGGLAMADINKAQLLTFDRTLAAVGTVATGRGLTDLAENGPAAYGVTIGSFSPTEEGTGQLLHFTPRGQTVLADGLQRPTSLVLLENGLPGPPEIVVTEFGKWTGRVSRWTPGADGRYKATTLSPRSGALAVVADTAAQVPTVYVLFGQGKEEIIRYRFTAAGVEQERVLAFPAAYGSSSLQLVDWNGDAFPDILYTNGDNADYVAPVKPYHGIRIYTGDAAGHFSEAVFLPFPGAYGAAVADFNQDGRQDIAAISFFPDYTETSEAGAVLFEAQASGTFLARRLPGGDRGRFMVLDAGDFDGDGDADLVAGCLALEAVPDKNRMANWLRQGLPFVLWENLVR
ncbi:VCBS repeat-containing protein [Neolewinella lacunae]|uniref:VCBS repeat-containing protein n=1 Tax=Neolewinella lacunae TaxID=1517758 RepID=A0A923PG93_9BACT|nr:VCBS repeat-containing protein [Neolewinella lacunae]MBC6993512.1 VCBS repeat-containing protein [Neolewinella lacunae]MDN3636212.1 VCBS repeat-containing protein [Neolewinella lacunae]